MTCLQKVLRCLNCCVNKRSKTKRLLSGVEKSMHLNYKENEIFKKRSSISFIVIYDYWEPYFFLAGY